MKMSNLSSFKYCDIQCILVSAYMPAHLHERLVQCSASCTYIDLSLVHRSLVESREALGCPLSFRLCDVAGNPSPEGHSHYNVTGKRQSPSHSQVVFKNAVLFPPGVFTFVGLFPSF